MPNLMAGTLNTEENDTDAVFKEFTPCNKEACVEKLTTIKCYNRNSISSNF